MRVVGSSVRCITYTHNQQFLASSDDSGRVKFSQPNFVLLNVIQAHKEPCRCIAFSPLDVKFATCSDDSTIKIHDLTKELPERTMTGHGGDVRWVDWHPTRGLLASGSKDHSVRLWDVRTGNCEALIHGHKNGVLQVRWNTINGNWLLSCSRDNLVKVHDAR